MKIHTLITASAVILMARSVLGADAAENWAKNCASCHGKDGSGSTIMGKKLGVEDYRDAKVQAKFTDAQATDIIKNGKDKMKSFKDKLTDDEIKALIAYVRGLKK